MHKHRRNTKSHFITSRRINELAPTLRKLVNRGVKIVVDTKPLEDVETVLHFLSTNYPKWATPENAVKVLVHMREQARKLEDH